MESSLLLMDLKECYGKQSLNCMMYRDGQKYLDKT